jgi:hypothetical protein
MAGFVYLLCVFTPLLFVSLCHSSSRSATYFKLVFAIIADLLLSQAMPVYVLRLYLCILSVLVKVLSHICRSKYLID